MQIAGNTYKYLKIDEKYLVKYRSETSRTMPVYQYLRVYCLFTKVTRLYIECAGATAGDYRLQESEAASISFS